MNFERFLRRSSPNPQTTESVPVPRQLTVVEHCSQILLSLAHASQVPVVTAEMLQQAERHAMAIARGSRDDHTQARRYFTKVLIQDLKSPNPTYFAYQAALMLNRSIRSNSKQK